MQIKLPEDTAFFVVFFYIIAVLYGDAEQR